MKSTTYSRHQHASRWLLILLLAVGVAAASLWGIRAVAQCAPDDLICITTP